MEHSKEELDSMKEYEESVDSDVRDFVADTISGTGKLNYVTVAFLSMRAAKKIDRKSTRLNSSHPTTSRMPSSA